jgi:hypothetical protein
MMLGSPPAFWPLPPPESVGLTTAVARTAARETPTRATTAIATSIKVIPDTNAFLRARIMMPPCCTWGTG